MDQGKYIIYIVFDSWLQSICGAVVDSHQIAKICTQVWSYDQETPLLSDNSLFIISILFLMWKYC